MDDVPQPSPEPYSVGDKVRVYLDEDDPDSRHHDTEGVVAEILEDSLAEETGRDLDSLSYRVETPDGIIDTWFRHSDLVPHEDDSTNQN